MQGEATPFLDQFYNNLQILEDNMCQYPECFMGISDDLLQSVRIVDSSVNVPDCDGVVHTLKQGDLIIRYDSGKAGYGYIVKNGSHSSRYKEKFIGSTADLNFKSIGVDQVARKTDWLFICDNFLSALAIQNATGVMTIAIPKVDSVLLEEVMSQFPSKNTILFIESTDAPNDAITGLTVAYPINRNGQSWAECRDKSEKDKGLNKASEEFKNCLRQSMKTALN